MATTINLTGNGRSRALKVTDANMPLLSVADWHSAARVQLHYFGEALSFGLSLFATTE